VVSDARLDWFILFLHPLTDLTSPGAVWTLIFGATVLLFALPFLPHPEAPADRRGRCAELQRLQPLPGRLPLRSDRHGATSGKRAHKIAVVDADLCAACGICAGSCPSSTPFRSQQRLVTGIDMPQLPVDALRRQLERASPSYPANPAGGLRLRPERRRRRPRGTRYRNAEPDLRRHAAALLRRIRPAQRRRRRGRSPAAATAAANSASAWNGRASA
jgi:ferredoxin